MSIHKLRGLEYLVAVVDAGSFNAAARRLGVAAQSVHRLVHALEAELRVPLLDRSEQPIRATPYATAYVERARTLLADMRQLDADLRDESQAPRGTITLAADSIAREYFLPSAIAAFHARHPEISLDVVEAGSVRDLARLGTDMMMQSGWPPPQDAILRTLADSRWLIVASPAYWARNGIPTSPADLARHGCGLFRTPSGEVLRSWGFERDGERETVTIDGWITSDSRNVLDGPLRAGQLVMRLSDLTVQGMVADGALQPVLLDWTGLNAPPLSLVVKRTLARQPRMRAWIEFAVDYATRLTESRLPAGLPPVRPAERPEWWSRRVAKAGRAKNG